MLVGGDIEVPDKCPEDCRFRGSFGQHGQSAICGRCPVFCCSCNLGDDGQPFWLVAPEEYRRDWALEWQEFFRGGRTPGLRLEKGEIER